MAQMVTTAGQDVLSSPFGGFGPVAAARFAELSTADTAKKWLTERFAAVHGGIAPVLDAPDEVENVHKLRVDCRRAAAALVTCRSLLCRQVRAAARRPLRAIRRAAGQARNWDLFLERLEHFQALQHPSAADTSNFLSGYAFRERDAAQIVLEGVVAAWEPRLEQITSDVLRSIHAHADDAPKLRKLAERELRGLIENVNAAVAAKPQTPEDRHQLRITCKRLHHTIEFFSDDLSTAFLDTIPTALRTLQDSLGELQDMQVIVTRLATLLLSLEQHRPQLDRRYRSTIVAMILEARNRMTNPLAQIDQHFHAWNELRASGRSALSFNDLPRGTHPRLT